MLKDKSLILNAIKKYYGLSSTAALARFLGVSDQNVRNWYARNTLNPNILIEKCSEFNPAWLLTGEGDMLRTPAVTQTVVGDGNTQVQGSGNTVSASISTLDKALDEIKGCHAMLQKSQQQIDRLLGIIETMQQQTTTAKEANPPR